MFGRVGDAEENLGVCRVYLWVGGVGGKGGGWGVYVHGNGEVV